MKAKITLVIFLLVNFLAATKAQKQGAALIDSLLKELPKHQQSDTNQVILFNQLGRNYVGINPSEASKFSNKALVLAELLHWLKGQATAIYNLGVFNSSIGNYPEALNKHFTALSLCKQIADKKGIANNYNSIAVGNIYQGNYPDAIKYLDSAAEVFKIISDKKGAAQCYNNLGAIYQSTNNLQQALKNYSASLAIFIELNDKERMSGCYNNIGAVYQKRGLPLPALTNLLAALKIDTELKNTSNIIIDHSNIAGLYHDQKNFAEALKNYETAFTLAKKINDQRGVALMAIDIGLIHSDKGEYQEAMNYASIALQKGNEINNKEILSEANNLMGLTYHGLNKFQLALQSYAASLAISSAIGDSFYVASIYSNMGITYLAKKDYKKAEACQTSALNISNKLGLPLISKTAHEELYNIYSSTGQFEKALLHYKQYVAFKDSLQNTENTRKITQLQDQFNFDQQADSVKAATEKNMVLVAEKNKEKIQLGVIGGGSLIVLLLGGFYFNRKREHDRFKLEQIQLTQDAIKARLDTHFVSGTLTAINDYAETNNKQAASNYLLRFSRLIRNVLENSFEKNIPLKNEIQFMEDYFQLAQLKYPEGHINYNLLIDKEINTENTLVPPMIFQVLVENALQHAFNNTHGGLLSVQVKKENNILYCIVEDNGVGRKATQSIKNTGRTSYGTSLAERLLKVWQPNDNQTSFNIEDLKDGEGKSKGTKATFSFPFITY